MAKTHFATEPSSSDPVTPPRTRAVTDSVRQSLYRTMQLIRRCEEQLARSHQRGLIHGACHTYVGQEAIAAGVCAISPERRRLQHPPRPRPRAGQGLAPRELIAELFGADRLFPRPRRQHAPVRS